MLTLLMAVALIVVSLLLSATMLWLSARIVRAGHPSFKRVLACALVLSAIGVPLQIATASFPAVSLANQLFLLGLQLLVTLLLLWIVAARILRISFPRAMLLSIPYIALSVPTAIGLVFVVKNYCLEAFVIPTNSMAPALVGWHHEAACPHCQGTAIISGRAPGDPAPFLAGQEPRPGICTQCRKISQFEKWPDEIFSPMRLVCNKLMQCQRGDMIVFVKPQRFDDEEKTMYVKRLIGLPGEKIEIKDDAVWINGEKWTPPTEVAGVVYYPIAMGMLPLPGENPEPRSWQLGPDEFFVLGDFTTNSSDSRDWGPVPRKNLVGPVTMIYWPPSACRILR